MSLSGGEKRSLVIVVDWSISTSVCSTLGSSPRVGDVTAAKEEEDRVRVNSANHPSLLLSLILYPLLSFSHKHGRLLYLIVEEEFLCGTSNCVGSCPSNSPRDRLTKAGDKLDDTSR